MDDPKLSYFERRLAGEIVEIEAKIEALEGEKRALLRQMSKARAERTGIQEVTRKNSLSRILAENSIVEMLQNSASPVKTLRLFARARQTNFDLKETTFRTYLHRMKKRGVIKTGPTVGSWQLLKATAPRS
jgi:sucrose-6-phosphate hydrolase SacC (GH32 family)